MVTVVVGLVALIGATALAIDVGAMWVAKTQLQNAADAAALAGAANLVDPSGPAVTLAEAEAAAVSVAGDNAAISVASVDLLSHDITFGDWDLESRIFDTSVDLTDPSQVTAVDVVTRMDASANGSLTAFMSRILGFEGFDVRADATAYLGYAGGVTEHVVPLPIALDCCELTGDACSGNFCPDIKTHTPNPCAITDNPQTGDGDVSCLEFNKTKDQNACWTAFENWSSTGTGSQMNEIIEEGVQKPVYAGEKYFVDNGTKTALIDEIHDKFHGIQKYSDEGPAGDDYYEPKDGKIDSWPVVLPVIECQDGDECGSNSQPMILGFVCFEIREVQVSPEKIIKGSFLCPGDARFAECRGPFGSGGDDYGLRADIPVLVR